MGKLKSGLLVSCQAADGEPLYGLDIMQHMARAAVEGGAAGIRALAQEIKSIKSQVDVPVIGLTKTIYSDSPVYITSTFEEIDRVAATGCECIAMDATLRRRHNGVTLEKLYAYARETAPHADLMADIDTQAAAVNAENLGFDYISTTLCGYTEETAGAKIPDYKLIALLKSVLHRASLIVEGGIWEPSQLERVLQFEPFAVVIGTAITRPKDITKRFCTEFERANRPQSKSATG